MMAEFDQRPVLLSSYNQLADLGFNVHMADFVTLRDCGESESQLLMSSSPAETIADESKQIIYIIVLNIITCKDLCSTFAS